MAVKFETIKPGDTLYDCHVELMGNTMCRAMSIWTISVKSVSADGAMVSWNGNPARLERPWYFAQSRIRRSPPEWPRNDIDGRRCYFCDAKERDGHKEACARPIPRPTLSEQR
jgi:hypothetical protein